MSSDLSKREKKLARELIEKGLQVEFNQGLSGFYDILLEWKDKNGDNREYYHKIFGAVKNVDKHIAWRYDGMKGSQYLDTVIVQLVDGLYDIAEVDGFSPEVKEYILRIVKWRMEDKKENS